MINAYSKEAWKNIPGYNGLYKASNLGRVYSMPHTTRNRNGITRRVGGRIRKPYVHKGDGRVRVSLYQKHGHEKNISLSRIIAMTFLPNYSQHKIVIHRNGNQRDNRVSNLKCVKRSYSLKTARSTGNHKEIILKQGPNKQYFQNMRQAAKWLKRHLNLTSKIRSIATIISRDIRKGRKAYGFDIVQNGSQRQQSSHVIKDEKWLPIPGYEQLYQISNYGRVRSMPRDVVSSNGRHQHYKSHLLTPDKSQSYLTVRLSKNNHTQKIAIHRMVAQLFVPNPHHYTVVNHKDENRWDNKASNLEWCTTKYNNNYGDMGERLSHSLGYPVKMRKGSMVYHFGSLKDAAVWLKKTLGLIISINVIRVKLIKSCRYHKDVYGFQARYINHRSHMSGKYTSLIY